MINTVTMKVDVFKTNFDILVGDDKKAKMKPLAGAGAGTLTEAVPCSLDLRKHRTKDLKICGLGATIYENGDMMK